MIITKIITKIIVPRNYFVIVSARMVYIYIYVVKLLAGPSLGFLNVTNWAKLNVTNWVKVIFAQ